LHEELIVEVQFHEAEALEQVNLVVRHERKFQIDVILKIVRHFPFVKVDDPDFHAAIGTDQKHFIQRGDVEGIGELDREADFLTWPRDRELRFDNNAFSDVITW